MIIDHRSVTYCSSKKPLRTVSSLAEHPTLSTSAATRAAKERPLRQTAELCASGPLDLTHFLLQVMPVRLHAHQLLLREDGRRHTL